MRSQELSNHGTNDIAYPSLFCYKYQKEINMSRTVYLLVLLAALLITGCSLSLAPDPLKTSLPTPIALESEWTINMAHSGGIMGVSRSIQISSNGKYTVTDHRTATTMTGELTGNELSKLNKIVSESNFESTERDQPSVCADCFIYSFEIQSNGKIFTCQADDITLPSSGLETLAIYLRDLMDKALK